MQTDLKLTILSSLHNFCKAYNLPRLSAKIVATADKLNEEKKTIFKTNKLI